MRYINILLLLFVVMLTTNAIAKNKLEWVEGVIKLNSGEDLTGNISYNAELDIVSYLDEGSIKAFTASKVISFQYFDDEISEKRNFVSLDFQNSGSYKTRIFFEQIVSGKISLIRRFRAFNQFYSIKGDALTDNFGSYVYYALSEGKFINLKNFKKQIFPNLVNEFQLEINDFLEKNSLNTKQIEHQVVIIDYYNFLADPERKKFTAYLLSYN